MRVINPAARAAPVTDTDKTDLQTALAGALASKEAPTFDEIRAALPAGRRARWTDGMIHQAALDLGLRVEP